ncbi:hypothetical protein [Aliarcobacter butzleri]|uniref:hypothetical protein n=1 Tax=Aliarcobacter butzleri TaxID=28197 RepID=UPI001EDC07FD|nr:hypothetical protein [Aliarcobacter butzleri]MCG3657923.1 hypothetical protein [Aliarcobacter butzleri]MDN5044993.1 hypothetical protein [Aliarcobacter butzleri]
MKKIVLSLVLLSFNLLFIGCATNEPQIIIRPKTVCFEFEKYKINDPLDIDAPEYDLGLANARSEELHDGIKFYESQIDRYTTYCKKQIEVEKEK